MRYVIKLLQGISERFYREIVIQFVLNPCKSYVILIILLIIIRFYFINIAFCDMFDPSLRKPTTIIISNKGQEYAKDLLNEAFNVFKHNKGMTSKQAIPLLFDMFHNNINRIHWYGHIQLTDEIGHIIMLRTVQALNEKSADYSLLLLVQVVFHSFTELNMNKALLLDKLNNTSYFTLLFNDYMNWIIMCRTELKQGYLHVKYTLFLPLLICYPITPSNSPAADSSTTRPVIINDRWRAYAIPPLLLVSRCRCSCIVSYSSFVFIPIRFYPGGKEIGHAPKLLQALSKYPLPPTSSLPSPPANSMPSVLSPTTFSPGYKPSSQQDNPLQVSRSTTFTTPMTEKYRNAIAAENRKLAFPTPPSLPPSPIVKAHHSQPITSEQHAVALYRKPCTTVMPLNNNLLAQVKPQAETVYYVTPEGTTYPKKVPTVSTKDFVMSTPVSTPIINETPILEPNQLLYVNSEGINHTRLPLQNSPTLSVNKSGTSFETLIQNHTTPFDINKPTLSLELEPCVTTVSCDFQDFIPTDITLPVISLPITSHIQNTSIKQSQESFSVDNMIPAQIKGLGKVKNPDGVEYETNLTSFSTAADLTEEKLIQELLKRNLIKKTEAPAVIIETEKDGKVRVGNKNNDLILTKHGHAYLEIQHKTNEMINLYHEKDKKELTIENVNHFRIIVLKSYPEGSVKTSPHMIAAYDPTKKTLHAFATFTSANHPSNVTINQEQFKKFQLKQQGLFTPEEENKPHNTKPQRIRYFANIQIISKSDVYITKFDKDYYASLDPSAKKHILNTFKDLQMNSYKKYVPQILSNELLLQMCKDVDKEAGKTKPKHPMTLEEQKKKEHMKLTNQIQQKLKK